MKYRYFRASLIVIVIAFTCAVGNSPEATASGPDNGKYCIDNGATMLLVRLGSNGTWSSACRPGLFGDIISVLPDWPSPIQVGGGSGRI